MYALAHMGVASLLARFAAGQSPRRSMDYRIVLVGSMIADLIDKPVGFALGISGRAVAHTGVFAIGLTLLAVGFHMRGKEDFLWLSFGNWTHLLLDGMWEEPSVLLYPANGWTFPAAGATFLDLLLRFQDPFVLAGEIVGGLLLVSLAYAAGLRSWPALKRFLVSGELPSPATGKPIDF